jgi:tetratricopeptide (TPR) repeat protein
LVRQARDELTTGKDEDVQQAIALFRTVLQRDAQDPYRWLDLGDAFLEAGQKEDARYCFGQVLALAPHSAPFLLRVADFYFQIGENEEALAVTARILALIPDYDSVIFSDYLRSVDRTEDVLRLGLPENGRAAKSWLRFLIQAGRLEDAQRTWGWVVGHQFADDTLAGEYVEFLIRQGHPDAAALVWAQYTGAGPDDYDKSTYLFNGDFESDPAPSPFDWNLAHTAGAEVARDCTIARSGKCSLRISFGGTQNLGFTAASQLAFVLPGAYRFRASIRTEALTTDQGIRFRISDAEAPTHVDEVFGQFTGSSPWTSVNRDVVVAPETRLLRIEVLRQPSMKFDNKVAGTAWIDGLELELFSPKSTEIRKR